ncbi:MAG: Glutamate synthase [NADPH] large chain, partial [uncultured Solirubrobacteraceae bacterium]
PGRGPPAPGRLRGRRLLPAPGPGQARALRAPADRDGRGRGPAGRRLARRPGRQGLRRHHRQLLRAVHQAARDRRLGRARRRPGRLRAQALRHPPGRGARRGPRARDPHALEPDDRLQGDAHRAPADGLLPRPQRRADEDGAGARALPLLDEHLPELGARAPVPDDRPQRGDQHAARQRQLDARPRVPARIRALRRGGPEEDPPGRAPGRLGLRHLRQRPRAPRARRPLAAARDDDDGPRGLRRPRRHPGPPARLLRLPRLPDGAVGRAGGDRVHRRPSDRGHAGPQRAAPGPLARDEGRLGRPGLGDRRHGRAGGEHRPQGPPAARQAVHDRPRGGPHRRRRGRQARHRDPGALRRLVPRGRRPHHRPARATAARPAHRAAALAPARVRLHAGGSADPARAHGRQGRGADRLDGQRRRARGALRAPAAAVLLLQAALRAGHEPADRPHPRGRRHERRHRRRLGAQPVRRVARARPPARNGAADPPLLGAREAAPGRLGDLRRAHDRPHLAGRGGRGRDGERRRAGRRRGLRGRSARRQHPHPLRPQPGRGPRGDPVAAGGRERPPPPRAPGHPPADRPRDRVGRAARGPPLRDADRLRRVGDQPVPHVRVPRRARREGHDPGGDRRRDGRRPRRQGDRQGPAQDHLEDGDLHDPVVLRRADLRGRRPRARARRPPLHGHGVADRRHRPRDARGRDARAPRARLPAGPRVAAAGRRRLRVAPRRGAPPVEPRDDLAAPARRAPRRAGDLRRVLAPGQRGRRPPRDAARPAQVPLRRGRRRAARRGRAGLGDRQALRDGRHVARLALARVARDAGRRHEPPRRALEHRRGRGGPRPLRRRAAFEDQAGRLGPLRGQHQLPRQLRRAADQDGPGRQARRGRPAARPQGRPLHREDPLHDARGRPHQPAAAPRHLLDRGPQAAHLRPALREPARADLGEARERGRRRDGRGGRREGELRPRAHLGARRRHGRLAALLDPRRGHPVGDRP